MVDLMRQCTRQMERDTRKNKNLFDAELKDVLDARAKVAFQICGERDVSVWEAVEKLESSVGRKHGRKLPQTELKNAIIVLSGNKLNTTLRKGKVGSLPETNASFNAFYKDTPEHGIAYPVSKDLEATALQYVRTSARYYEEQRKLRGLREWFKNAITTLQFFFFHVCDVNNIPVLTENGQKRVEKRKILSVMTRGFVKLRNSYLQANSSTRTAPQTSSTAPAKLPPTKSDTKKTPEGKKPQPLASAPRHRSSPPSLFPSVRNFLLCYSSGC